MLYGIVDMGSNSIRLSIFREENGVITQIISKKVMAGLAGYVKKGKLTQSGIEKACLALETLREVLDNFNVDGTGIFATASLRNICNQDEVLNRMQRVTGIAPEIISGKEEARLDFVGATRFYPMERGLLVDIGGGSTELVWFGEEGAKELISIPVGSLALHTQFVSGLIPGPKEREKMRKSIREQLDAVDWAVESGCTVCGIGGTMRMALQLSQELLGRSKTDSRFSLDDLEQLLKIACSDDPDVSKPAYKIVPERMFSMVPGLMIIREVARKFGCADFFVSRAGVREGYLITRFLEPALAGSGQKN